MKILHTPNAAETRPGDCSVYQRLGSGYYRAAHLVFTTAPYSTEDTTGMRWTQFAVSHSPLQGGGVMIENYTLVMNCAAVITPSLGLFILAFWTNLLSGNEQF